MTKTDNSAQDTLSIARPNPSAHRHLSGDLMTKTNNPVQDKLPIIVVGLGGAGRHTLNVVVDMLAAAGEPAGLIAGVLDDNPTQENLDRLTSCFPGVPYLGTVTDWLGSNPGRHRYVIGIGSGSARRKVDAMFEGQHEPMTVVHPDARLGQGVVLGPGTVVSDHVALDTNVTTGRSVHINQGAVVGHDSSLGDYASLNPSSCISGNVRVKSEALVGATAGIIQGVDVGRGATVGMGAMVVRSVDDSTTVVGVPAAPIKPRKPITIGLLTSIGRTLDAFFVEIVDRWREQGARVVTAAGDASKKFSDQTVIEGLTRNPHPSNRKALSGLRDWVESEGVDVVVTNTATASMLVRAARVSAPVVYFAHGLHWNDENLRSLPYRAVEMALLRRTAGAILINQADEDWFAAHAPSIPRLRLANGVGLDVERFARRRIERWDEGDVMRLVWCGEFTARKNPLDVVSLVHLLLERGVNPRVTMLGTGELDRHPAFEKLIAAEYIHRVGHADPVPYFEKAHALVQTALWEGLPRVALEAVAMGLPTAGYDVKGVQDIPGAYLAKPNDPDALAAACVQAATQGARNLPALEEMTYAHAADAIWEFVQSIKSGQFPQGRVVSR